LAPITFASLGSTVDSVDREDYTISPSAPTIGKLGLLCVNAFDNTSTQPPPPTVTGFGTTWDLLKDQIVDNTSTDRANAAMFAGVPTSSSGSLTVDYTLSPGGNLLNALAWAYVEVTDADVSGGGSGAVVTANTVGATAGAAGTAPTVNYAQAIANGNACFAVIGGQLSAAFLTTPRANWTELTDTGAGSTSIATEYRVTGASSETAASGTITSTRWGIIAVEVKQAAAATKSSVIRRDPHRGLYMR
jgi:hypothetical protein